MERGQGYQLHYYNGKFHRVPEDWRFPRIGVLDIWRQWWIGDTARGTGNDLKHLNAVPLGDAERHGRTGTNKGNRRVASKALSDLSYLMKYMTAKVEANGGIPQEITVASVDEMYNRVSEGLFHRGHRDAQKKWNTVCKNLRKRVKDGLA